MAKSCPVNFQKVDENQIRIQALFVTFIALAYIFTGWVVLGILLVYDFVARLFVSPKISLFALLSVVIGKLFKIPKKLVDSAPKIFASRIGLGFSVSIVLLIVFSMDEISIYFAIVLAICASLDALLNYCVGCKFYAILHHFNIV